MSGEELDTSVVVEKETEFEAAFNEVAEAKEAPVVDDDLDPDLDKELDKEAEAAAAKLDDDKDKDKDKTKIEDEVDPYAGMSEDVKARVIAVEEENKNLNHRLDSDAGRVSAFQLKINGMEKEIQAIRQGATAGEQPSTTQIADAMKGTDDEWVQFSEDYPEVAKAIDSRLDQAGKATQETIDNTLSPIKETQAKNAETQAEAAAIAARAPVTEIYPKWEEAVKTNEFGLWLDGQSPGVQALAGSDDSNDASLLIGLYDTHLVNNDQPSLKAEEELSPDLATTTKEKTKLAVKRAQQLEDGTTIKSKNSRIDPSKEPVDDFDAAFNYHANRKERKRTG